MIKIVQHNTVCFIERLGKIEKILKPGMHFYIPIINKITRPVYLNEQMQNFAHEKAITNDNVELDISGVFFFQIIDPEKSFYNVENYQNMIKNLSVSVSRSEIGKVKLDKMIQNRDDLNESIKTLINEEILDWGIECKSFEILQLDPPKDVKNSLKYVANAERIKRKDIIISEAEKLYQISISDSKKIKKVIIQEGMANGIKIRQKKVSEGMNQLMKSLKGNSFLLNYIIVEKYIENLKNIFPHSHFGGNGKEALSSVSVLNMIKNLNLNGSINLNFDDVFDLSKFDKKKIKKEKNLDYDYFFGKKEENQNEEKNKDQKKNEEENQNKKDNNKEKKNEEENYLNFILKNNKKIEKKQEKNKKNLQGLNVFELLNEEMELIKKELKKKNKINDLEKEKLIKKNKKATKKRLNFFEILENEKNIRNDVYNDQNLKNQKKNKKKNHEEEYIDELLNKLDKK